MSSTWTKNNEKSLIKNEHSNDDEHSNLSNSSNTTSSSTTTQIIQSNNQQQQQQIPINDSIYSESTTLKNLNLISSNNLQQEHGKKKFFEFFFRNILFYKLESGQFIRSDLQSYTDPIVYYGDGLMDPLQQNYSHLQQGQ
jgi:hypothetical protein